MNLTSSEYKEIARGALRGHWGGAVVTMILAALLGAFCTSPWYLARLVVLMAGAIRWLESVPHFYLLITVLGSGLALFYFFVGGAINYGYIDYNLALLDRRPARTRMLFSKLSMLWKSVYMKIALFLVVLLHTIFLIVPGVIASYRYAMVPYVMEERPAFSVGKAMRASRKMMRGHKWQLFCLHLSFLGWYLLGILTCGLAFLYVIPYRRAAEAVFYNEISGRAATYYGRPEPQDEQ